MFKTKKAAKEAGYLEYNSLINSNNNLVPCIGENPIIVKDVEYWRPEQCEQILSKKSLKEMGLKPKLDAIPVTERSFNPGGYRITFQLYRLSDSVEIRKIKNKPPVTVDLLLAVFTVNRTAKRYRDNAQNFYRQKIHGFAKHSKSKKQYLYSLKDKGIRYAYNQGLLEFKGMHGKICVYESLSGYRFHAFSIPENVEPIEINSDLDETFKIPKKVKTSNECSLKDAVHTLSGLPDVQGFKALPKWWEQEQEYSRDYDDDDNDIFDEWNDEEYLNDERW
jgi:hypothetical protein